MAKRKSAKKKAPKRKATEKETAEPEATEPQTPKPQPTKARKGTPKFVDGFAAFAAKSQKTWPGATALASDLKVKEVPRISSGNIGLDIATYGGFPRGRFSRVYGREKSAKTGTCLNTVSEWQNTHCGVCYERGPCAPECQFHGYEEARPKAGALWVDAEHRLAEMWGWVEGHGVDRDRLLYVCPPDGQHVVDCVDAAIREHGAGIGLFVVDSIAHITSDEEIKKPTVKGKTMAVNAQLIGRAIRKWTSSIASLGVASTRKPTIILINQIRLSMEQFGSPEIQPGGKSLDFCSGLDIRFSSGSLHYLVTDDAGAIEDKSPSYGSRWKPGPDDRPDYVEINYRVTNSGVCPSGRYGQFNYWLRQAHDRRIGDPDNIETLWNYVTRLQLVERGGGGYNLFDAHTSTKTDMKARFFSDTDLQRQVWEHIVVQLMKD